MASIETLITQIDDPVLRDKLGREVAEMKRQEGSFTPAHASPFLSSSCSDHSG